jgi:glutamate/aspartate transport system substrate-binding protein
MSARPENVGRSFKTQPYQGDHMFHSTHPKALLLLALSLPVAAHAESTLAKVKHSGEISVGYRETSVPFAYLDDKSQPVGFGFEICQRIVDGVKKATGRADLKTRLVPVTSSNRIPLLVGGNIDVECGSTTNNVERAKQVDFGINYFYTGTRFLVKAGTHFQSLESLKGKTVVSTLGTTNFRVIRNLMQEKQLGNDLLGAKDHTEAAQMVQSGRAFAFGMDDVLLFGLRAGAPNPSELAVVGESIQVEPYAPMIRKDDPEFKKVVDETIAGLMKSGEFLKIYNRWFTSPIPPKGINIQLPMGKELKENLKALSDKPAV